MRAELKPTCLLGLIACVYLPLIVNQDLAPSPVLQSYDIKAGSCNSVYLDQEDPASIALCSNLVSMKESKYVGTNACAQCHRDGYRSPSHSVAGKEYSIWADEDPHSRAYQILFDKQSLLIANNLKLETPPHKNDLCLNCHSTNVPKHQLAHDSQSSLKDGVGCESCHGGAENWLVQHKLPGWKYRSPRERELLGFVNTDNLASRARKCAECHVGSEGRDVNHDLIAAGHPRLYFEMAAYQAKLPRHWSRAKELAQIPSANEARLWLVGQFVNAAAALDQLHRRVINFNSPWPEFSEYGCFSCHHNLAEQRWQLDENAFATGAGKLNWGSWDFSTLDSLSHYLNVAGASDLPNDIQCLRDMMQNTLLNRIAIGKLSEELSGRLNEIADCLAEVPLSETEALALTDRLFDPVTDVNGMNWDGLTQRYLAASALRQAILDFRSAVTESSPQIDNSKRTLIKIRDSLRFDENNNGPRKLDVSQRREIFRSLSTVFDDLKN